MSTQIASMLKVLIILGHPRRDSYCGALAESFACALRNQGAQVEMLILADLRFEPNVISESIRDQPLEPDLTRAMDLLGEADHLAFVYPVWWGTMPALLKAFLDRILLPDFAFTERDGGGGFQGLLVGKSAHLITTMDTPLWVVRWILRKPGHRAFETATLNFCGVSPVRTRMIGPVRVADAPQRLAWLASMEKEASLLRTGKLGGWTGFCHRAKAWIRALRLQFYPMSWMAYTAGGAISMPLGELLRDPSYWLGYGVLFSIEAITVFLNEIYDFPTDRENRNYSAFSGGSRVLVGKQLGIRDLFAGVRVAGGAAVLMSLLLMESSPTPAWINAGCVLAALGFGIFYTTPPLKFCHRGAGELVVAFTHSLLVVQCGASFTGGPFASWDVWALGIPIFVSVLPSIILSGIPDSDSDRLAGKKSLAVLLGPRRAFDVAILVTVAGAAIAVLGRVIGFTADWPIWASVAVAIHGVILVALIRVKRDAGATGRMDALMITALTFIMWFVLIPLAL